MKQAMEAEREFYNEERCHSRCDDQPPAVVYEPSTRRLPADFDPSQVPITRQPTVVTRQVQAGGGVSLVGRKYYFSQRYARQTITVTVDGWSATARAEDGWQRTWDLHPTAQQPPADPLPPTTPKSLSRKVSRRGTIQLSGYLYYIGLAWAGQSLTVERQPDAWFVNLLDGSTKTLPLKHLFPRPTRRPSPAKPSTPPSQQPEPATLQTRRVTKTGQVSFYHCLYYVGIAHAGQTVYIAPLPEGLSIFTLEYAWITTCPWKEASRHPDKPLCPT